MIHIESSGTRQPEKEYIFSVIFSEFLGTPYTFSFQGEEGYTKISLPDGSSLCFPEKLFTYSSSEWLTKKSHPALPLRYRSLEDIQLPAPSVPVLYGKDEQTEFNPQDQVSFLDIDIFGSIFFLITLYEEYKRQELDEYGRFLYTESILYKEELLARPLANEYVEILWQCLSLKYSPLHRKTRKYEVKLSHDVDLPLAHIQSHFEFIRSMGADVLLRRSFPTLGKRIISRFINRYRFSHDPHNNFSYLMEVSEQLGLISEFNFITEDGKGTLDERYEINTPFLKKILREIHTRGHRIGLHPSYFTFDDAEQLQFEFDKLKNICEELNIHSSLWGGRQHFLRWANPITWQIWNTSKLNYDSSVGSEYFMGFRAGTCYPYSVFDLENREHLDLIEYPLVVMDIAAFKLGSFENYSKPVVDLSKTCKHYNGTFSILIHNNYVISRKQKVEYESLLKSII